MKDSHTLCLKKHVNFATVFFFLVANSYQSVAVLTTWCQVSLLCLPPCRVDPEIPQRYSWRLYQPNGIKIDPYNFEVYRFKVYAFF